MNNDQSPRRESVINKILRANAAKFGYKYLPVQTKEGMSSQGNAGRWFVEEVFFAPSKISFLAWAFKRKSQMQPGGMTLLWIWLVSIVAIFPLFLVQAIGWQLWRIAKSGYGMATGTTTYLDKERLFGKDKSKKD